MKDLVGHQFRREQPLTHQAFGQDVDHPYELIRGHGEIFFFRDRVKPLLSERITLGRELGNLDAELLMRERIGQAREPRTLPVQCGGAYGAGSGDNEVTAVYGGTNTPSGAAIFVQLKVRAGGVQVYRLQSAGLSELRSHHGDAGSALWGKRAGVRAPLVR